MADHEPTGCLACVGEQVEAGVDVSVPGDWLRNIEPAITWAPSWQAQQIGGQTMFACIALPTCGRHLTARPQTAQEKASKSGLWIGGQSPQ